MESRWPHYLFASQLATCDVLIKFSSLGVDSDRLLSVRHLSAAKSSGLHRDTPKQVAVFCLRRVFQTSLALVLNSNAYAAPKGGNIP